MRHIIDSIEYEKPHPVGWSKQVIEEFAEEVAKTVEYRPGNDLHKLVESLGGNLQFAEAEEVDDGSICVRGPGDFDLFLSRFTSTRRNRFTIAHELGHYAMHSNFGRKRIRVSRYGTGQLEWEANWFAAAFLMPEEQFRKQIDTGCDDVDLAIEFNVSVLAAQIRRERLT